jgi:hypothetical protein
MQLTTFAHFEIRLATRGRTDVCQRLIEVYVSRPPKGHL